MKAVIRGALAGVIALSATAKTALAGPMPVSSAPAMLVAPSAHVEEVRAKAKRHAVRRGSRSYSRGNAAAGAAVAGAALGILGAAIGAATAPDYYYGPGPYGYSYGYPSYGYPGYGAYGYDPGW